MGFGGNIVAGFIKGAADQTLDQVKRRQDLEQQYAKEKMLEGLRLDTEKEMAVFKNKLEDSKVDHVLSAPDYDRGVLVYRNADGEEKGTRPLTPSEKLEHEQEVQKNSLGLDNIRSEMSARSANTANDNARLGISQAQLGLENRRLGIEQQNADTAKARADGGLDGIGPQSKHYYTARKQILKSGVPASIISTFDAAFQNGVVNEGWDSGQQNKFITEMLNRSLLHDDSKPDGRPLADKFNRGNSLLDSKLSSSGP